MTDLPKQNPLKATLLALITFLLVALVGVAVKKTTSQVSTWTILFFQYAICLCLQLPVSYKEYNCHSTKKNQLLLLFLRGLAGVCSYFFAFTAMKTIPLVNSILLWNTAPLWIPFISLFFLKIKLPRYAVISAIIGFIGICSILHPRANFNLEGSLCALIAGILFAITIVTNRNLIQIVPTSKILLYYFSIATITTIPMMILSWKSFSLTVLSWLFFIGLGTYISQYCFTVAAKYGHPGLLAPMSYTAIIFSALFDWLIWHISPHWYTWFGCVLIITAGIFNIWHEQRK